MKDYNINEETVKAKLKEGEIYNSNEIKELFDQQNMKNSSRQYFNNRLSRFASFTYDPKDGLYAINEIYTHPLPTEKEYKYDNFIKILLLYYLLQQPDNTAVLGRKRWWEQLNMVNSNYLNLTHKTESFPTSMPTTAFGEMPSDVIQYNIQTFFKQSYTQLNNIFKRALDRLQRESFIIYSNCFLIKEYGSTRLATDDECELIMRVRRETLESFNLTTMAQLMYHAELAEQFYKACEDTLYNKYRLSSDPALQIFDCIKIIFTKEGMERQIERGTRELEAAGMSLNQMIMAWSHNWALATKKDIKPHLIDLCADTYIARGNAVTCDN